MVSAEVRRPREPGLELLAAWAAGGLPEKPLLTTKPRPFAIM